MFGFEFEFDFVVVVAVAVAFCFLCFIHNLSFTYLKIGKTADQAMLNTDQVSYIIELRVQ